MMDHPLVITIDSWDVYHSQSWVLYDIVIPFKKTMIIDISSIKHDIYIYLGERYQWITGIGLITMGLELSNYPSWHHLSKLHQKPWPNHGSVGDVHMTEIFIACLILLSGNQTWRAGK